MCCLILKVVQRLLNFLLTDTQLTYINHVSALAQFERFKHLWYDLKEFTQVFILLFLANMKFLIDCLVLMAEFVPCELITIARLTDTTILFVYKDNLFTTNLV